MRESMKKLNIEKYDTKCRQCCSYSKHKKQFCTHDLPSERLYKVVLRGLHQVAVNELGNELKLHKLSPESIKIITPNNARYVSHVNYIIYFKKGEVKLDDLRKIRSLFHTIVSCEPYRIRRSEPIQCRFSAHGVSVLDMALVIAICYHAASFVLRAMSPMFALVLQKYKKKAEEASANGETSSINVAVAAKCCNCELSGHFASDPECSKEEIYAERRIKRSSSNIKKVVQP